MLKFIIFCILFINIIFAIKLDEYGSITLLEAMEKIKRLNGNIFTSEESNELHNSVSKLDNILNINLSFGDSKRWQMCTALWGRYCGPGYCDGNKWDQCSDSKGDQKNCNFYGSVKDNVDSCCRQHDKCCVNARTNPNGCMHCRSEIISCLDNTNTNSPSEAVIKQTFKLFFKNRIGCC
jgi:hypothetical protein